MKSLLFGILAMMGVQPASSASHATVVPGASARKVAKEREPPVLGGYSDVSLGEAADVQKFLNNNLAEVKGLKLVGY